MRLWVDRWILSLPLGHPMPRGEVVVFRNTRVKSLICENSRSWDIDFLMAFLSSEEKITILDIVIGDTSKKDRLVWPFDKHGGYTVKSGYH